MRTLRNLAAEEKDEQYTEHLTAGTAEEFCDYLDADQAEMFQQMAEAAEQKKKWLRLFEKMQKCIQAREFDEAYTAFEVLSQEIF